MAKAKKSVEAVKSPVVKKKASVADAVVKKKVATKVAGTAAKKTPKKTSKKTASKSSSKKSEPLAKPKPVSKKRSEKRVETKSVNSSSVVKKPVATAVVKSGSKSSKGPVIHALVIGCDLYLPNSLDEGSYPSLGGCVSDGRRIAELLKKRARLNDQHLILLTSTDNGAGKPKEPVEQLPTYENIVGGFRTLLKNAAPGDHVYIHYSGHGGRCPTIVPKIKGANGLDETLVPVDIGNSSARYVRDVEIVKLLNELSDQKLVVTVVFDCCHSGGATRAVVRGEQNVRVRGVEFVDRTKRSQQSLVGTPAELEVLARREVGGSTRGFQSTRGMAATAETGGSVVLAACRPSELAREFPFDGGPSQGALTYWLCNSVGQYGDDVSIRQLFDVIEARIHGQFPMQTPMLFGDPNRAFLGQVSTASDASIPVLSVTPDGQKLTLKSGLAGLVQTGAEFTIHPAGTQKPNDTTKIALVRVSSAGSTESKTDITKLFGKQKPKVGDLAVPAGISQRLIRTVRVLRPDGKVPAAEDRVLTRVRDGLAGSKWLELATNDSGPADFLVTTNKNGETYQICDSTGEALAIRPELKAADPSAAKSVVDRLTHLSRYQAVRQLDNTDPLSTLRNRVSTELLQTPKGFQLEQDLPQKLTAFPAGQLAHINQGEVVVLSITNNSADDINVVVLDLGPDWAISVAHPDDPFIPVDQGGGNYKLKLKASLPDGIKAGRDTLKVLATVDPPPATEMLVLPALDQPIVRSVAMRSVRGGSASPLDALVAAVASDTPTRGFSSASTITRGWMVSQFEIETQ